jgi:hypothetical protein
LVNVARLDPNGGPIETNAQLDLDPPAPGLDVSFSFALADNETDRVVSWNVVNNTATSEDVTFLHFLDAEIDELLTTFSDELLTTFSNESASTSGRLAAGQGFEADERGFHFGGAFEHPMQGALDVSSVFPPADDVSLALSSSVGARAVGDTALIWIMISEDGDFVGGFALEQTDADPSSTTTLRDTAGCARP